MPEKLCDLCLASIDLRFLIFRSRFSVQRVAIDMLSPAGFKIDVFIAVYQFLEISGNGTPTETFLIDPVPFQQLEKLRSNILQLLITFF